jgi:hypothetical protein
MWWEDLELRFYYVTCGMTDVTSLQLSKLTDAKAGKAWKQTMPLHRFVFIPPSLGMRLVV